MTGELKEFIGGKESNQIETRTLPEKGLSPGLTIHQGKDPQDMGSMIPESVHCA